MADEETTDPDLSAALSKIDELERAINAEREHRHQLEVKLATPVEKKHEFSRTELETLVADGKISETQREEILDQQREERLTGKITDQIAAATAESAQANQILALIEKYTAVHPELLDDSSPERRRIVQEVAYQATLHGRDKATHADEAAALRAVYGPAEALQKGRQPKQSSEEVGSDTDEAPKGSEGFTKREIEYGKHLVSLGLKKDLDEYKDTLKKHGNPVVRRRYGASV